MSDGSGFGKNVVIFGAGMSSSVHNNKKKRYISIPGKGPTQRLNDTALTAEKEYVINFNEQQQKYCLSLHYNGLIC